MKLNPFEISKIVSKALKNKNLYEEKFNELKKVPLEATVGQAHVVYDIERNRIGKIEVEGIDENILNNIVQAVNLVFDKSDKVWTEIES